MARRIRALEEALGVALFQRGPNSLDLTEAGRAVLEAASPMAEAAGARPRGRGGLPPRSRGPVRITATTSVTLFLSPCGGPGRRGAADRTRLPPDAASLDLAAGEADIALRMRQLPEGDDLVARKIGRIAFAIYASTREPAALIIPPEDPNLSQQAALIALFGDGRPVAARIGDMPIRYQAAKTGLGAAVLPCWLGDADAELVRVLDPPPDMVEDVYLITHPRSRRRPAVTAVAAALAGLFRREQPDAPRPVRGAPGPASPRRPRTLGSAPDRRSIRFRHPCSRRRFPWA